MGCRLLPCILLGALLPACLMAARRGDVNDDGTVDGRDALRIAQVLEGRVPAPPPEDPFWIIADVHPTPAVPGAAQGDGAVTRDDALTILRLAMGLLSSGEFDGVYGQPVIHSFSPISGLPGTHIAIHGENFVAGLPAENLVAFGDLEAVVESSTATELVVVVPAGAVTAPVYLATPGGWAWSDTDFFVTAPLAAEFRPPAGEARQFLYMSRFGEATPSRDGQLVFEVDPSNWTVLAALPRDNSQAVYLALHLSTGARRGERSAAEVVDARSTARALVFLSPFFLNWNNDLAAELWKLVVGDPQVEAFGAVAETVMPGTEEPFADPGFAAAYRTALESVAARIPAADKPAAAAGSPAGGGEAGRAGRPSVYSRDFRTLTIEQEFDPSANGGKGATVVNIDTIQTNPLDWRIVVAELRPDALFDLFPKGAASLREAETLASYPRNYEADGFKAVEMRLGKAITRRFAILTTLMSDLVDAVGMTGSGLGPAIAMPDREGVYIVRCFAPVIDPTVDGGELRFLDQSPSDEPGTQDFRRALAANLTMLIVDSLDAAVGIFNIGSPSSSREVTRATTTTIARSLLREFPDGFFEDMPHAERFARLLRVFQDGVDAAVKQATTEAVGAGKDKLASLIEQAGGSLAAGVKTGGSLLNVLDVISYLGPIGERLAAMAGHGLIERFGLRLSPMETAFLMIGTPFEWEVDRIEPATVAPGDQMTLIGRKFDHRDKDNNQVFFKEIPQLGGVRAETVSVSEDGTRLTVVVPHIEGSGYTNIYLRTPFAQDRAGHVAVLRKPWLRSLSPEVGFAARAGGGRDAFAGFQGTFVRLDVDNAQQEDKTYFGGVEAREGGTAWALVPPGLAGLVEVYIRTDGGVESNRLAFQVLHEPSLHHAFPQHARIGELVTVSGVRFGTVDTEFRATLAGTVLTVEQLANDRFVFKMPAVGEAGEELPLVVETPAGASAPILVTREAGVVVPERPNLPAGYAIIVTDPQAGKIPNGMVSLDEALAFARGDQNPFLPPWDNENIDVTEHWTERKRFNNDTEHWEYYFEKTSTETETRPGGPGDEFRRTYRVDHYHPDKGGGSSAPQLISTENLDLPPLGTRQEGDYVQGAVGGAGHQDTIQFQTAGATYNGMNLELGPNDRLVGNVTVRTNFSPIVLHHKTYVDVAAIEARDLQQGGGAGAAIHIVGDLNDFRAAVGVVSGAAVLVDGGIGNQLRVDIAGTGGHGVLLRNAHHNVVWAKGGPIRDCAGDGIRIDNGQENEIDRHGARTENCTGAGLRIVGGRGNRVLALGTVAECGGGVVFEDSLENSLFRGQIEDCVGHGLAIVGGGSHAIRGLTVQRCLGHGLLLDGSSGNTFLDDDGDPDRACRAEDNQGYGLLLTNGSSLNRIANVECHANAAGVVVEGANTSNNALRTIQAGAENAGNRGPGMHLRGGANDNTLFGCSSRYNQGAGVLIEGEGSSNNRLEYVYAWHCQGAGIVIRGPDVSGTRAANIGAVGCQGDGVVVEDGAIDTFIYFAEMEPCAGVGVVVRNGAQRTTFHDTTIMGCQGGGVLVDGVSREWEPGEQRYPLTTFSGGLTVWNPKTRGGGAARDRPLSGIAIVNGTTDVHVQSTLIHDGEVGILLAGPSTARNRFAHVVIRDPSGDGIRIEEATDTRLSTYAEIRRPGGHGMFLRAAHGTEIADHLRIYSAQNDGLHLVDTWAFNLDANTRVESPVGHGLLAIGCSDAWLTPTLILHTGQNGVELRDCTRIHLYRMQVIDAGGHGLLVDGGCSDIRIEEPDCLDNAGAGIQIAGASQVTVERLTEISGNQAGIVVEGGRSIRIAEGDRYNGIRQNATDGVLVHGGDTESVQIQNCLVEGNAAAGIRVEAGRQVAIGGDAAGRGNLIAGNAVGIAAQGPDTEVEIGGNLVGPVTPADRGIDMRWLDTLPGNVVGIQLAGGIEGAKLRDNTVRGNTGDGVLVQQASGTVATGNRIEENQGAGVRIQSADSNRNMFGGNRITRNRGQGIVLEDGANDGIAAPVVRRVSQHTVGGTVQGVSERTMVEVYADQGDEGGQFIGAARARAGGTRQDEYTFSISAQVPTAMNVTAMAIDADGNTSTFGPPYRHGGPTVRTYAFASTRGGASDVFLRTPQGTTNLTDSAASDRQPQLSPDGQVVAFVSDRGGTDQIWRMPVAGGEAMPLTTGQRPNLSPAWHPQGQRLAFASERDGRTGGHPDIYTFHLGTGGPPGEFAYEDGTFSASVAANPGVIRAVRFSTDPGPLAAIRFYIVRDADSFAWQVNAWDAEGGRPGELLAEGETTATAAGWHTVYPPGVEVGGEFVVGLRWTVASRPRLGINRKDLSGRSWRFTSGAWNQPVDDNNMIRATVAPRRLTDHPAIDQQPAWSPDGATIAFASDRSGDMAIWTMNADGSNPQPIPGLPGNQTQPRWSPDGNKLVFISDADGSPDLWIADADGANPVNLTPGPEVERDPCWTQDDLILFASEREAGWEIYQMRPDGGGLRRLTTSFGDNLEPHAP